MPPDVTASATDPQVILLVQLDHLGDAILVDRHARGAAVARLLSSIEVLASPWNREVFEAAGR